MIKHKQLNLHDPDNGVYGDCQRTVLACLLDMSPADVPNFGTHYGDSNAFNKALETWLASKGFALLKIAFNNELADVLRTQLFVNPGMYYMLAGMSRTGCNHVVICLNDGIFWDPSITDSGIVAPCDDGHYWIEYLVPKLHKVMV